METPLIEFRDVTKRFNGTTVLDRTSLSIYENRITTIIGKSGTGKSVLLKHIIGLLSPDEGSILYKGRPVNVMKKAEWDGYRGRISYMFQNNALFDSMSVFDNIALPLRRTTGLGKKEILDKVTARLEQLELTDVVAKFPSELSGGMQKRAALARALVTDPAVVLFDEPTTGQDPIRKNIILSMIARYRRKLGFTAVLISHDIPDVFFISDNILLLWEGKIAFSGTYEELGGLRHPMIDEFMESLEGLRDELTGLPSKEMFKARYALTMGDGRAVGAGAAVLFGIRADILTDALGPQASVEVLRALGEHANRYFGPLGGLSVRQCRDEFLTILPNRGVEEAEQLVLDFAREFEQKTLPEIKALSARSECFEIFVVAGITGINSCDDVSRFAEKAKTEMKIVARYLCDKGEV